jgi:hypothetical protein
VIALASLATLLCYRVILSKYDQGMHATVTRHLQQLFPACVVTVGKVSADLQGQIIIHNVRLAAKANQPKRPLMSVQRAVLIGDLDIADWAHKTTCVDQVQLTGVKLDIWPDEQGNWSISALDPQPDPESSPPSIEFHDVMLRLYKDSTLAADVVALHDIQGRISPQVCTQPSATDSGLNTRCPMRTELTCQSSGVVKQIQLSGYLDPNNGSWDAQGRFEQLNFSPRLLSMLPPRFAQYFYQLSGLECQSSCTFSATYQASQPIQFEILGTIVDGRLRDPRLPYPLEELNSDFFCNNNMLQLRSMRARSGATELELNTDIMGFRVDVPIEIHASVNNLALDHRLYESLPEDLQKQWDLLQPAGNLNGTIQLSFDGQQWTPSASIECLGVSLNPWIFPYPLNDIRGQVQFRNGTFSSAQLQGLAGGQAVTSEFSLSHRDDRWVGRLACKTAGPVAVDEQLISALTQRDNPPSGAETFVRSLSPRGTIELTEFALQCPENESTWHRSIDAKVYGGSIQYHGFPYPIYDIRGRIVAKDDQWWLDQFEGHNDSGHILCSGSWKSAEQGALPFELKFDANAIAIEDELYRALTLDAQSIWNELQPAGSIDRVQVLLTRPNSTSAVTTRVSIQEQSASNRDTGRSLRIEPRAFPFILNDLDCSIDYSPGSVVIHNASGVNGDSRLSIRGQCQPQADGRWLADIQWQPRTRVIVDGQLLKSLPKTIRESLVSLDFRGPLSVLGTSQILFPNQHNNSHSTAWDCQLDVENGQLGDGNMLGAMRGTIWTQGVSHEGQLQASGNVSMDALTIRGIPVTRLQGPFAMQGNNIFFGSQVADKATGKFAGQAVEMTADTLTGKLTLSGTGMLDTGKFDLNASLKDADLDGLLQDVGVNRVETQALCDARLSFNGIPWNTQTWSGEGDISLRDAKLLELPFMIRLMRVASVNADDDSAFQRADIHFDIDGDRIPLSITCDGEILRLRGEGWTNLRKDIDLELYSYVGRRPIYSVVSPLLSESRYATFMMIEITGTLDNPVMERRPFPQIEATLQQIFPEVAERRPLDGLAPWRQPASP